MIYHRLELSVPRHLVQLAMVFTLLALTTSSPIEARSKQPVSNPQPNPEPRTHPEPHLRTKLTATHQQMPVCPHEPAPATADLPPGFQSNQWTSFQHYCTASNPGPNCRCLTDYITGQLTVECLPQLGNGIFAQGPVVATNECLLYCTCTPIFWAGVHPHPRIVNVD